MSLQTDVQTVSVPVSSAWSSKINWTQAVAAFAMILTLVTGGKIGMDPTQQAALVVVIGVACNIATWVMKTFFTSTIHAASLPASATPLPPVVKVIAIFAVLLASLILGHPAMAQSSRINTTPPKPALTGNLAKDIKAGLNPASTTTTPAASQSDDLAKFMAQLEKVKAEDVAAVIADIQLADVDAGTIITPAIAASPAVPATATSPAVPAFAGSPAVVKDPISHACWPAATQFLQSIPAVASPTGKFIGVQLFQAKRDFVAQLQAGLPTYLKLGCSPLLGDEAAITAQIFNMIGIKVLPATLTALMPALAPVTLPAMILNP